MRKSWPQSWLKDDQNLQKYNLMQKKYFFSHSSVPFPNFSFATLLPPLRQVTITVLLYTAAAVHTVFFLRCCCFSSFWQEINQQLIAIMDWSKIQSLAIIVFGEWGLKKEEKKKQNRNKRQQAWLLGYYTPFFCWFCFLNNFFWWSTMYIYLLEYCKVIFCGKCLWWIGWWYYRKKKER